MPSVQIRDVPDETHRVLRLRAAAAHRSLQEYLRARLIADAATPTLEEVLYRAGGSVPLGDAVDALTEDRARPLTPASSSPRSRMTERTVSGAVPD